MSIELECVPFQCTVQYVWACMSTNDPINPDVNSDIGGVAQESTVTSVSANSRNLAGKFPKRSRKTLTDVARDRSGRPSTIEKGNMPSVVPSDATTNRPYIPANFVIIRPS